MRKETRHRPGTEERRASGMACVGTAWVLWLASKGPSLRPRMRQEARRQSQRRVRALCGVGVGVLGVRLTCHSCLVVECSNSLGCRRSVSSGRARIRNVVQRQIEGDQSTGIGRSGPGELSSISVCHSFVALQASPSTPNSIKCRGRNQEPSKRAGLTLVGLCCCVASKHNAKGH